MRRAAALVLAALCVLLAACGQGDDVTTVDWDLSGSHTLDDVRWPEDTRDLTATEVRPEGEIRIRLPDDQEITAADGEIRRISLTREGDVVTLVSLTSEFGSRADAVRLARKWAGQFSLPTEQIEAFAGDEQRMDALASAPREAQLGGPDGPIPQVLLRDASTGGDDQAVARVEVGWDPPGAGTGTATAPAPQP